jgi:phosphoribosylanthranilate isomerase
MGQTLARSGWPVPAAGDTLVKVCGIKTPEGARAASESGVDFVGFVHFPPSPRHLDVDEICALHSFCADGVTTVVVTVDADDKTLDRLVRSGAPSALQLHGSESPERVAQIEQRYQIRVLKALGIEGVDDVARANEYACLVLLDAKPPKDATRPGGLGKSFDWSLLDALDTRKPFLLSGGLTPDSVGEAVERVRPYGVDVSSGVETDGVKDPAKMAAFISAVRPG